jgi:hypothetical protein
VYDITFIYKKYAQMFASEGNLLLHDGAGSHSAAATVEAVGQMKFELLSHTHIARPELHRIVTCLDH